MKKSSVDKVTGDLKVDIREAQMTSSHEFPFTLLLFMNPSQFHGLKDRLSAQVWQWKYQASEMWNCESVML